MPARGALYTLLDGDAELAELVGAVYHANTVDTPAEDAFVIIKHEAKPRVFGSRGPDRTTIWVHHRDGLDYGEIIDPALERIKELVLGATQRLGPDGWVLTVATWNSDGPDLVDGGYDTITRWADFDVISRYSSG